MNINNIEVSSPMIADNGVKRQRESPEGPIGVDTPKKSKSAASDLSLNTEEENFLLNVTSETAETIVDKDITMREIVRTIKAHIVPATYPNHVLNREEANEIINSIGECIDKIEETSDKPVPTFTTTYFTKGTIKTNCIDESTLAWLNESIVEINAKNVLDGNTSKLLKVFRASELPSWDIYRALVRSTQVVTGAQIMSRIKKQNTKLSVNDWVCTGVKQLGYGALLFVQMDPVSVQNLKEQDFSAFYLMTQIKFSKYIPHKKGEINAQTEGQSSNESSSAIIGGKFTFFNFIIIYTFPYRELIISILCIYVLSILSVYQFLSLLLITNLLIYIVFYDLTNFCMPLQRCSSQETVLFSDYTYLILQLESIKEGTKPKLLNNYSTCNCLTNGTTSLLSELLHLMRLATSISLVLVRLSFSIYCFAELNSINTYTYTFLDCIQKGLCFTRIFTLTFN
jgi:hypothetical protein